MDTTEGKLDELGNNLQTNLGTTYSFITIGETMLQQVVVPRGLDNFLRKALDMAGSTTIYTVRIKRKHFLVGVKTPDGKIFYHEQSAGLGYALILVGIPCMLILIGFIIIYQGVVILELANAGKKLESMGGTGIA